ncbi:hypothetical protein TNCV_2547131 [Trichonephila clavipes]|nr:hypothetical protein TNCV_2547131 [Trichonephila clavipes]
MWTHQQKFIFSCLSLLPEVNSNRGEDLYPRYHRRSPEDGAIVTQIKENNADNRCVVPYNRFMYSTFNAHINVEFCNYVKSIKFICKYVIKEPNSVLKIKMRLQGMSRVDISVALKQSGGFFIPFTKGFLL